MAVNRQQAVGYAALLLVGLLLVGFGGLSAYAAHLRVKQVSEGKTHRTVLPDERCSACHTSKHKAPLVGECENCHVTSTWKSTSYRHEKSYLVEDAHASAPCNSCHLGGRPIKNASCETCHKTYNHRISTQCQMCHTTSSWTVSHDLPRTHPRLEGTHAKTTCPDCHTIHAAKMVFSCGECHKKEHGKIATTPAHKDKKCVECHIKQRKKDSLIRVTAKATECSKCHGTPHKSLTDCARCHASSTFKKVTFTHPKAPLAGSHAKLSCEKCHPKRQWATNRGTACTSCHKVEHRGLLNCTRCHNKTAWRPTSFVHSSVYKLDGAHSKLSCGRCHPGRQWGSSRGTACSSCHGTKHDRKMKCDRCHTTRSWRPIKPIQHSSKYPLVGLHRYVECESCHKRLVFRGTANDCDSCHAAESHGMPKCERCHTPVSWKQILPHMGGGM